MSDSRGLVYIATGEKFVEETLISAESVKQQMPDINITLMTDSGTHSEYIDRTIQIDDPRYDFGDQVFNLDATPYDRTLFLDSDTYLNEPVWDVFELLDEFDVAASQNQVNYSSNHLDGDLVTDIPESFPEYNSGVVACKKTDAVSAFFDEWQSAYQTVLSHGQIHNQAAFRAALYRSDIRLATLPQAYNCLYRRPGCVNDTVKIYHGRLLDIDGPGAGEIIDIQHAMHELNK